MKRNLLLFHRRILNKPDAIYEFVSELDGINGFSLNKALFGMEQTGIYCNPVLKCLKKLRANVILEDALQIKRSLGKRRGKTDAADSREIASYLYKNRETLGLWRPKREIIQYLSELTTLRNRLMPSVRFLSHGL
ncbi:IS110 family transposase [Pedobacter sp.]|uniref:IS110 family transposase n=1 Tax=Pedobacter sp. TaxID=1411316 RepID=UPI003BAB1309